MNINPTPISASRGNPVSRRPSNSGDAGFSLVELLVVVVIIAILSAIAIPVFLNQRGKAMMGTVRADFHNVMMGVESARQPDGTIGTSVSVRDAVVETVGKTTSPNMIQVYPNCAQNVAGTAVERSSVNYIIVGYRMPSPGTWAVASGTTTLTYNSKTRVWETNQTLYDQIQVVGNPCRLVNGGNGYAIFVYDSSNAFTSGTG